MCEEPFFVRVKIPNERKQSCMGNGISSESTEDAQLRERRELCCKLERARKMLQWEDVVPTKAMLKEDVRFTLCIGILCSEKRLEDVAKKLLGEHLFETRYEIYFMTTCHKIRYRRLEQKDVQDHLIAVEHNIATWNTNDRSEGRVHRKLSYGLYCFEEGDSKGAEKLAICCDNCGSLGAEFVSVRFEKGEPKARVCFVQPAWSCDAIRKAIAPDSKLWMESEKIGSLIVLDFLTRADGSGLYHYNDLEKLPGDKEAARFFQELTK